ncbi:predicted protein [Paecilomyces variotii No. 5]|uniref:Uncharacterized protein n=1 Tax=Byssochlamys spectabilis (strain No. 5 / NBRC 109023) TaxID=1356009 RepID=V5HQE7_BYSSN|nr:predicted protein [Paecilomyces variotii No. 5]
MLPTNPTPNLKPQPPQRFEFISVSGEGRTDPETLRRIHSHAQSGYRRRKPVQRRQRTVELDPTPLIDGSLGQSTLSLTTCLDDNRSDPFQSFNLGENRRAHRLWDHVYDGTCAKFRTLIAIGFIDRVRETIALSQLLSASAWHLVHRLCCEDDMGDDARYSMITTRSLQTQLNSLNTAISDEAITAVLACAAYANLIKEPETFQVHMDGLLQILRHRGGEQALDSLPDLRISLFWIEINGRVQQDATPQYPLPYHILVPKSKLNLLEFDIYRTSLDEDFDSVCESLPVKYCLQQLVRLSQIVGADNATATIWNDPLFPVFHIHPLLQDFLSMTRGSVHDSLQLRQRECFRLAGIIYLLSIRSKIDFEPGAGMLYGTKLRVMLETPGVLPPCSGSVSIIVWALVMSACSPVLFEELRGQYMNMLSTYMQAAGIADFESLLEVIRQFPWCYSVFGDAMSHLDHPAFSQQRLNLQNAE